MVPDVGRDTEQTIPPTCSSLGCKILGNTSDRQTPLPNETVQVTHDNEGLESQCPRHADDLALVYDTASDFAREMSTHQLQDATLLLIMRSLMLAHHIRPGRMRCAVCGAHPQILLGVLVRFSLRI